MKDNNEAFSTAPKIEKLHWHIQHWKSDLQFMENETSFIHQLLNSDIFKPNTPNLFERIQKYLTRLGEFEARKSKLRQLISKHENHLGGLAQFRKETFDATFYHKHDDLEMEVLDCTDDFKTLKAEIYNYVSGTIKKA
ncbi:hypothetical protein [Arenibacter certesii]|uniref:Uncharacterized protein n=1 Tax=Arenibacter certesii TaxID=228955 RepID=A0A918J0X4_9FLAO|nr:hypothetical protein [Arenibacter certesii]GGW41373.1 hypothetical protein GCM10007383_27670 [Arenibacter certesii]